MAIDVTEEDSPGWWMWRLARKLERRQPRLRLLDSRFRGEQPLPHGAESMTSAYRDFQKKARTNFAEPIVEEPRKRMQIVGFRTGAADDDNGDLEAWRIYDANGLTVESASVHENMLNMGDGYVIIGDVDDAINAPVITSEDPRQVVTIHDPVQQRKVLAALKLFRDIDAGYDYAYLYRPGRVYLARRRISRAARADQMLRFTPTTFDWSESHEGPDGAKLSHNIVPVVRFRNHRGVGEFEPHVDLLDRIDHQILQRLVIAAMQAFRQRAVKGTLPERDSKGQLIDYDGLLSSDPGALWRLPSGVDLWESSSLDLSPILKAVEADVRTLAWNTSTPIQIYSGDNNQSAEGAAFKREGLTFKVEDRCARAAEGWKDVMSIAFLYAKDEARADRSKLRVLWGPAERRSLAERADAAVKAKASGVPWRAVMTEIWGFSAQQVEAMDSERAADAFLASIGAPTGDDTDLSVLDNDPVPAPDAPVLT